MLGNYHNFYEDIFYIIKSSKINLETDTQLMKNILSS